MRNHERRRRAMNTGSKNTNINNNNNIRQRRNRSTIKGKLQLQQQHQQRMSSETSVPSGGWKHGTTPPTTKNRRIVVIRTMLIGVVLLVTAVVATIILIPIDSDDSNTSSNHIRINEQQQEQQRQLLNVLTTTQLQVTSSTRTNKGTFQLLETVPHDRTAFTQGLVTVLDRYDGTSTSTANTNSNTKTGGGTLKFYEGTGLNGQSQLRLLDIHNGTVLAQHSLPYRFFGEGITHYMDSTADDDPVLKLVQITWQEQTAFDYIIRGNTNNTNNNNSDSNKFSDWWNRLRAMIRSTRFCRRRQLRLRMCRSSSGNTTTIPTINNNNKRPLSVPEPNSTLSYTTTTNEGWGITYSKLYNVLYVTDGSQYIHTWNATTKREISTVPVLYQYNNMNTAQPLERLNEIEYDPISHTLLANVWYTDVIARIDIRTGFVVTMYNTTLLYPNRIRTADTFNGIALTYDSIQQLDQVVHNTNNSATTTTTNDIQTDEVWVTGKLWPNMYRIRLIDP